ncbi:MAG: hypothetical protein RJB57_59 [Actinomycetota bacterium]|jgi:uncharacterized OB-fold protein
MSTLPVPAPLVTPANERFWAATAQNRFELQRCTECDTVVWFPQRRCPECWTESLGTFDAAGTGTVYSFTVVRRGNGDWRGAVPFVLAYVELDEGPRVLTNIVDCDPDDVHIDMPVSLVWHDTGENSSLYRFRPATR